MAYTPNTLALISGAPISLFGSPEQQTAIFAYTNTVDSLATVLGANYIANGQKQGMTLGSIVLFYDGVETVILQVSALQAPSVAAGFAANPPNYATPGGVTLSELSLSAGSTGVAAQYTTAALQSAAIPVADVIGADVTVFDNTGVTPGNLQFPTAAALFTQFPDATVGFSYVLKIRNDSSAANTATITTNTGVTLTGTMTIAQNVTREFIVTFTAVGATPTVTVQSIGVSAAGA